MKEDEITKFDIQSLRFIAFFLEGYKLGKGDLIPMGNMSLESLWKVIDKLKNEAK